MLPALTAPRGTRELTQPGWGWCTGGLASITSIPATSPGKPGHLPAHWLASHPSYFLPALHALPPLPPTPSRPHCWDSKKTLIIQKLSWLLSLNTPQGEHRRPSRWRGLSRISLKGHRLSLPTRSSLFRMDESLMLTSGSGTSCTVTLPVG